jgi:hypothetical protein
MVPTGNSRAGSPEPPGVQQGDILVPRSYKPPALSPSVRTQLEQEAADLGRMYETG